MAEIPLLGPSNDPDTENMEYAKASFQYLIKHYMYGACVCVDEYTKTGGKIGKGSSGDVYKAQHIESGRDVALKKLAIDPDSPDGLEPSFIREINILKGLDHENIVRLEDVVVGKKLEAMFLVLEYCTEDLRKVLEQVNIPLSQDEIKNLMKQLFTGLEYIHAKYVIHRDINPTNLLLNQYGVLKIADFGSSRHCCFKEDMTPNIGTLWYKAPEMLFEFDNYTKSIDIWSAGCILGELLKESPMFASDNVMGVITKIIDLIGTPSEAIMPGYSRTTISETYDLKSQPYNWISSVFENFSDATKQLLKLCLVYNGARRLSATNCLKHAYFTERPLACDNTTLITSIRVKKND